MTRDGHSFSNGLTPILPFSHLLCWSRCFGVSSRLYWDDPFIPSRMVYKSGTPPQSAAYRIFRRPLGSASKQHRDGLAKHAYLRKKALGFRGRWNPLEHRVKNRRH
jgi:hypothetical protein